MGRTNRKYLSSSRVFGCVKCRTHLTTVDLMISRVCPRRSGCDLTRSQQFNGQHGRAYLFSAVSVALDALRLIRCSVNITEGPPVERTMTTGQHIVRDIACCKCETTLGWKYVRPVALCDAALTWQDHATEPSQKYKEVRSVARLFSADRAGQVHPRTRA